MSKQRILSVALSALLVVWIIHFATNHLLQTGSIKGHTVAATQGPSALVRALRPNFPYSVIPGGAYSQGELQYAHGNDTLVRAHYSDFDVKHSKLVSLTDDRFQYVSYRLKDQIYWTKRKLRIPKGELLLTDGVNYARTRCGNRLSDLPHQAATSRREPDPGELSLPDVTPEMLPKMALSRPPSLGEIPGIMPLLESHTGASASPMEPGLPTVQTVLPGEPSLTGFASGSPGMPVLTTGGGTPSSTPSHSSTPTIPGTSSSPTPPPTVTEPPATLPPADVVPVPEPSTFYFFLVILVISVLAILRVGPKDNPPATDR